MSRSGVKDDPFDDTEGVGEVGAAQEHWVGPIGAIERLRLEGKLTDAEASEVDELIGFLVVRWNRGEITEHFVALVLQKVADDKARDWVARSGRTGVWGK